MKKIIALLLSFAIAVAFTACKTLPQESSSATESTPSTLTSVYSELANSEEMTSAELDESPSTIDSHQQPTVTPSSSNNTSESSTPSISSKCSHPDYWEGSTGLHFIGGWYDRVPGIENKFTLHAKCEEQRKVVYKCPNCLEPVLAEILEPTGHDFSGNEEVLIYPTLNSDGSWGKTCQNITCSERMFTTVIPKRGGSYETIDSCFRISGNDYEIDNPRMIIMDRRTWGDVPTIVFDTSTCTGTISYTQQNGTVCQVTISVNKALLDEGWRYKGTILESGAYDVQYSRWGAWDGATPE